MNTKPHSTNSNEKIICKHLEDKKQHCLSCQTWRNTFLLSQNASLISNDFLTRRFFHSERLARALCLFFINFGQFISSKQILLHVWPNYSASPGNVPVLIFKLRQELKGQNVEIVTIRKEGYMLTTKTSD
ncbi:transcriptional regulator [Aeromonas sp. A5]|uniref:winged helix-turn-helix domain-containing protein n=1 Tax=unclassified Aeromonas TaxID=257493 RepID=UPI003770306B